MNKPSLLGLMLFCLFSSIQAQESSSAKHGVKNSAAHQQLPYAVDQAIEGFASTSDGGIMQILAKAADDTKQIQHIQQYLQKTAKEYNQGDFSSTEKFHGTNMPGLAQMKAAKDHAIRYEFKTLNNGGQILFSTRNPQLLNALHDWIAAQIKEHGSAGIDRHQ